MFNYSLATPSIANGMSFGQYTLPYDYMGSYFNNTNYLQNSLSQMNPYMMQGYNFYNPMFAGNNTSNSKTEKKEGLEYTPFYASEEITKSAEQPESKNTALKSFTIAAAIVATVATGWALISGARNFNGTAGQYIGNLFKTAWGGVKNFFNNTVGRLGNPLKSAGTAVAAGVKNFFNKTVGRLGKPLKSVGTAVAAGAKTGWAKLASGVAKIFK